MSSDALNITRRKLNDVLGAKSPKYFNQMNLWFRMKLTKEEFDAKVRKLLNENDVHVHNDFLLALLNRVDGLSNTSIIIAQERMNLHFRNSRTHKRVSRTSEMSNFDADQLDYLPPNSPLGAGSDDIKYAIREVFLPDRALVVGRLMLAAWEHGLEGADDDAAELIMVGMQNFLKNIITAVISQRKAYKMKGQHYMHGIGGEQPNMWLNKSKKLFEPVSGTSVTVDDIAGTPSIDEEEQAAASEIACSASNTEQDEKKISINELYDTLSTQRNLIASHSVYAVNMERLALMLNHPSH